MIKIVKGWYNLLSEEFEQQYFKSILNTLTEEYSTHKIYPPMDKIFTALNYVPYDKVKVVIIGQDPYHQPNQAMGMSFSVPEGVALPPSLKNIFAEIESDIGQKPYNNGDLSRWAKQGVLLLNTVLTVRESQPNSHKKIGWETFTTKIIELLNKREEPIVFLLWGGNARAFKSLLTNKNHYVLETVHPSPLSAYNGFFGSKHFSKTNEILTNLGQTPIDWR
ncbi:MAG: uracil-DNA glycosylase [Clostridia bacterium]|nr:uracil-DNA glycosylase [Clostridia bacterium]